MLSAPQPNYRRLIEQAIERMPETFRSELRESATRLSAIRSPKQARQAFETEYEHILRYMLPVVISRPRFRHPASAATFTAGFAALAATAEEADELLTLFSAGSLTAPGTSVVIALGLVAAAAETYAAASIRVHQLRRHGRPVEVSRLASDVRLAVLGDADASINGLAIAKRVLDGAGGRMTRRWAVGAVPVVGIGYAAFDSARTVQRVLQIPLPNP